MKAWASVGLHPTENKEKVLQSVHGLFPGTQLKGKEVLMGKIPDLALFRELVQKRKIRPSLEKILEKNFCAGRTYILLNKQAAFMGTPNVYSKQELGAIKLEFECEEKELKSLLGGKENEKNN